MLESRPLVLDTVSLSDTFEMYLYWHIDTFFMENVLVYQYISCCRYFYDTISLLFDQNIQENSNFCQIKKQFFSIFDNISYFKNLLTSFLNIMILSFAFLQKLSHKNAIKTGIKAKN